MESVLGVVVDMMVEPPLQVVGKVPGDMKQEVDIGAAPVAVEDGDHLGSREGHQDSP